MDEELDISFRTDVSQWRLFECFYSPTGLDEIKTDENPEEFEKRVKDSYGEKGYCIGYKMQGDSLPYYIDLVRGSDDTILALWEFIKENR